MSSSAPDPVTAPDPPAPGPGPRPRRSWHALTARRQFALLCVLGMLMVATPLVETLRRQADTLTQLQDAERRLAPMHATVALQRALIDHRLLAAASLGGQREREMDRRAQQDIVDLRVDVLEVALTVAREPQALVEHGALHGDWRSLAARIGSRRIDAAGSNLRHGLLLDQTIQIGDLLATAPVGDDPVRARLAWQALPALEQALAEAATGPAGGEAAVAAGTPAPAQAAGAAEAAEGADAATRAEAEGPGARPAAAPPWGPTWRPAWQRVVQLEKALHAAPAAAEPQDEAAIRHQARAALDALGRRDGADELAARLAPEPGRSPATTAAGTGPATRAALPALRAWGDALRAADGRARGAAVARAQAAQRAWQIGAVVGLLALVGGAVALWRRLPLDVPVDDDRDRPTGGPTGGTPPSPAVDATPRLEASRLLDRLREPSRDRAQPQDTGY